MQGELTKKAFEEGRDRVEMILCTIVGMKVGTGDFGISAGDGSLSLTLRSENEEEMLLFIASSGTYGTLENSVAKGVKEKGKFGYFMQRVFPPYSFYKSAYPWAYKCPILIPFAWIARFFRVLFKNPKRAKNELKTIQKYKYDGKENKTAGKDVITYTYNENGFIEKEVKNNKSRNV